MPMTTDTALWPHHRQTLTPRVRDRCLSAPLGFALLSGQAQGTQLAACPPAHTCQGAEQQRDSRKSTSVEDPSVVFHSTVNHLCEGKTGRGWLRSRCSSAEANWAPGSPPHPGPQAARAEAGSAHRTGPGTQATWALMGGSPGQPEGRQKNGGTVVWSPQVCRGGRSRLPSWEKATKADTPTSERAPRAPGDEPAPGNSGTLIQTSVERPRASHVSRVGGSELSCPRGRRLQTSPLLMWAESSSQELPSHLCRGSEGPQVAPSLPH